MMQWENGKYFSLVFGVESSTDALPQHAELNIQYMPFNGGYISAYCPVVLHSVMGKHTQLQHNASSLFLFSIFHYFLYFPHDLEADVF